MVKLIRAKTAGFCFGVALALKKLDKLIEKEKDKKIFTLGPIIHNPQVLEYYRSKGVVALEKVEDLPGGEDNFVVIRAHGIPKDLEEKLKNKGLKIVDATCPKVKKAQMLIKRESSKGKTLLLFGEKTHPEVKGLLSYAVEDFYVFETIEEFREILSHIKGKEFFLAAQTTQDRKEYNDIVTLAKRKIDNEIVVFDTICDTTRDRQKEAIEIAKLSDCVVVVGGYNSGNTKRLAKVVRETGCRCIHIEDAYEIKRKDLLGCQVIGLTAGASTPKYIIDRVEEKIKNLLQDEEVKYEF